MRIRAYFYSKCTTGRCKRVACSRGVPRRKVPKKVFSLRRVSCGLQEDRWAAVTFKMRTDTHSTCLSTAWQSCQQCREPWNACKSILRIVRSTHTSRCNVPPIGCVLSLPAPLFLTKLANSRIVSIKSSIESLLLVFFFSTMWKIYYARIR